MPIPLAHPRELAEPEELRRLEINPDDGETSEGGIDSFTLPQPIMNRMLVGISTPKERLEINAGVEVNAQSTRATMPRGQQQAERMTFRKPKVTFATTPFEEKEASRPVQNETTPRTGVRRRTIFEDDVFGVDSAWKRAPAKSPDKHTALIEVRSRFGFSVVEEV